MRHALAAGRVFLALGVASCTGDPAEPAEDRVRVIGRLGNVVVPDQVDVHEALSILVMTAGDSCTEIASTEVAVQGRLVRVVPYNEVPAPNSGVLCLTYLKKVPHAAAAIFSSPGEVTIRVVGSFFEGTEQGPREWVDSLDYTVTVSP